MLQHKRTKRVHWNGKIDSMINFNERENYDLAMKYFSRLRNDSQRFAFLTRTILAGNNASGDASLSRAFHRRIAGCRSLCNFVTSSIRPCNSVMTRNDPAASPETGRMRMRRCQRPYFLSNTSTILPPPIPTIYTYTGWDIVRFVVKDLEKFYSRVKINSRPNFDPLFLESRVEG